PQVQIGYVSVGQVGVGMLSSHALPGSPRYGPWSSHKLCVVGEQPPTYGSMNAYGLTWKSAAMLGSMCTCAPVLQPELPMKPSRCPHSTVSPSSTAMLPDFM